MQILSQKKKKKTKTFVISEKRYTFVKEIRLSSTYIVLYYMVKKNIIDHLQEHGVKPTSVRILVWKECDKFHKAFTLQDMEERMPRMDRSSIFRALRLFTAHHLLHEIDDGTGFQKYCVCRCKNEKHLNHIHFSCRKCGRTFCLEDYAIPIISLPEGYVMEDVEYVVKGICPNCQ